MACPANPGHPHWPVPVKDMILVDVNEDEDEDEDEAINLVI